MGDGDDVWKLPPALRGRDIRLKLTSEPPSLSSGGRPGPQRNATKAPEVVVKLTGRARGAAGHLLGQLDYITRDGRVPAETQDGEIVTDRVQLREIHDEWLLANAAEGRGTIAANAAQSVALTLSMPPGTPPDRVEAAARRWARDTFAERHDWVLARHDDTGHPHVHIAVRAVGRGGHRLAPGPADLQRWREGFARELRRLGVEADATLRVVRPRGRTADHPPARPADTNGRTPHPHAAIWQSTAPAAACDPASLSPAPADPAPVPVLHRASPSRAPEPAVPLWPRPRGRG